MVRFQGLETYIEMGGPYGAIYLQFLVLFNTGMTTQKGMATFQGLETYIKIGGPYGVIYLAFLGY